MERLQRVLPVAFYSGCVWLLTYLALLLVSGGNWSIAGPLLLLFILDHVLFLVFRQRRQMTWAIFIALTMVCALIGLLFFHFRLYAGFLLVIIWSYFLSPETRDSGHLWGIFLISTGVAVLDYLLPFSPHLAFLAVLLAELVFIASYLLCRDRKNLLLVSLTGFFPLAALALGVLISYIWPFFLSIFNFLYWKILSRFLSEGFSLFFALINHLADKDRSPLSRTQKVLKKTSNQPPSSHQGSNSFSFIQQYRWLFLLLIVLIAALILFRFYRKRKINQEADSHFDQSSVTIKSRIAAGIKTKPPFWKSFVPPVNPIRRAVFQLQKEARKKGFGRAPGETLNEWVRRLGVPSADSDWISCYEKMRYGEKFLDSEEKKRFFESLHSWKKQIEENATKKGEA
ncbi:MAG: hypothetical protein ABF651_02170 [Sporolactobacillus sp.]